MRLLLSRPRGGGERRVALIDDGDAALAGMARWWRANRKGYVIGTMGSGAVVYLHRLVLGLEPGDGLLGDHMNGDKLDNRRGNLRVVTTLGNNENTSSRAGSTSRFRGVSWDARAGRWRAQVKFDGQQRFLGVFDAELDAALAAHAARCEHMPFALADPELVKLGLVGDVRLAVAA